MSTLADAVEWLRGVLPLPAVAVREQASAAGFSWATIRRAQAQLGVRPEKTAGGWLWRLSTLPDEHLDHAPIEHLGDAQQLSTLPAGEIEHLAPEHVEHLGVEHLAAGDVLSTLPASRDSHAATVTVEHLAREHVERADDEHLARRIARLSDVSDIPARVLTGDALASHLERQMDAEIVRLAGIVDMRTLPPELARQMDEHLARIEAQAEREAIMSVERDEG